MSPNKNNVVSKVQYRVHSLCIPKVNVETTKGDIFKTFNTINIVKLEKVDIIYKKSQNGEDYKMVFLHFNKWYDNPIAENAKERILSGNDIKVVYAFPWFWKITASRT